MTLPGKTIVQTLFEYAYDFTGQGNAVHQDAKETQEQLEAHPMLPQPPYYATVLFDKPKEYWDTNSANTVLNEIRDESRSGFRVESKLITGRNHDLLMALNEENEEVLVEIYKYIPSEMMQLQLLILRDLADGQAGTSFPYVPRLLSQPRPRSYRLLGAVMEYIPCVSEPHLLLDSLTPPQVAHVMYQVINALDYIHSMGVIHRGIDPSCLRLTDDLNCCIGGFGVASFFFPGKAMSPNVGTPSYRAPELLVGCPRFWYAVDIWAVGCILASALLHRWPLFPGSSVSDVFASVVNFVGTDEAVAALPYLRMQVKGVTANSPYDEMMVPDSDLDAVELDAQLSKKLLQCPATRTNLESLLDGECDCQILSQGLDLAAKLLTFNPFQRISASEALTHPFFSEIREKHTT